MSANHREVPRTRVTCSRSRSLRAEVSERQSSRSSSGKGRSYERNPKWKAVRTESRRRSGRRSARSQEVYKFVVVAEIRCSASPDAATGCEYKWFRWWARRSGPWVATNVWRPARRKSMRRYSAGNHPGRVDALARTRPRTMGSFHRCPRMKIEWKPGAPLPRTS